MKTEMRTIVVVLLTSVFTLDPVYAVGDVSISFANGRVTVIANEVSLRVILDKWSKLGGTEFINNDDARAAIEQLSLQPMQIHLFEVPEAKALQVLFRAAKGFIAEPRSEPVSGSSRFRRVLILATNRTLTENTLTPVFSGIPSPPPAQRDPRIVIGSDASGRTQDTAGSGAIETLRRILPQPLNQLRTSQPAPREIQPAAKPATAPRPGMPVSSTDESAPAFIR